MQANDDMYNRLHIEIKTQNADDVFPPAAL
jgi:hypothetical protein